MEKAKNRTGIILAGGKSSRMGEDKGFVKYQNKAFVSHIIDALKPFVETIIIVSDNTDYDVFGYERVADIVKEKGPIGGLYSGLFHTKTEQNIVLSCDVPLVNKELLEVLINEDAKNVDAIVVESNGKTMPLIAMYKKYCWEICQKMLENEEYRMMQLLEQVKTKNVTLNKDLEKYTSNINTKEELFKL